VCAAFGGGGAFARSCDFALARENADFSVAVDFFPLAGQLDGRSNKSNGYIPMFLW
jgi:hypothetical protein